MLFEFDSTLTAELQELADFFMLTNPRAALLHSIKTLKKLKAVAEAEYDVFLVHPSDVEAVKNTGSLPLDFWK